MSSGLARLRLRLLGLVSELEAEGSASWESSNFEVLALGTAVRPLKSNWPQTLKPKRTRALSLRASCFFIANPSCSAVATGIVEETSALLRATRLHAKGRSCRNG